MAKHYEEKIIQVISTRNLQFISIDEEFDVEEECEDFYTVYNSIGDYESIPKHQCRLMSHLGIVEFEVTDPDQIPKSVAPEGIDLSDCTVTITAVKDILEDFLLVF